MSRGDVTLVAHPQALVGEAVRMDGDDVVWVDPPNRRLLTRLARCGPPCGAAGASFD
jgi:hypothetical protein